MTDQMCSSVPFVLQFSETVEIERLPQQYDEEKQVGDLSTPESTSTTSHRRGCLVEDD